jgi:hypothetical protein
MKKIFIEKNAKKTNRRLSCHAIGVIRNANNGGLIIAINRRHPCPAPFWSGYGVKTLHCHEIVKAEITDILILHSTYSTNTNAPQIFGLYLSKAMTSFWVATNAAFGLMPFNIFS